ncbi:exopolysaccharide transport family protein [Rhizobium rhizoryzae]|uniref:Exopolysaccharide transport family protein n=1 Tax=Rhizobium rhizoryzae TaxID=451876 RepID=A0A7W6LE11_9HYPH|nr:exopolysaccharide transport family protein [Rhizobium rhizoryzae]MBB4142506.1 exopolysaccharide transport family protein [Rhizobium rhizoryzae]
MSGVSGNQDADIDIGQLMSAVWERRMRILATTILAGGIALAIAGTMTPAYKAETRLLIETRENSVAGRETQGASEPVLDQYNIVSQAQILQSADLIKAVARDLKLADLKEFDPEAHSFLSGPLVAIGMKSNPMDTAPEERVLKAFREKLQVYPVEGSRIIAIEFSSQDPKLAAAVPNRMADLYLSMQSGAKIDTHTETTRWLEPEIQALRTKVQEAEKKVADYRTSAGLFRSSDNTSFSERQLNDISTEIARVRTEKATAEAKAQNVKRALDAGTGYDTLNDVIASPMIQRLKETEANLQAQIADLSISMMDGHPRLRGLKAQLAGIRQQIQAETRKILAAAESEAQVANAREVQLNQQLTTIKADSARAGEEEVGLRALEREAAAQRQLLESYLSRYREAASRADRAATPADARVISTAVEPSEPYFPKVVPITIVVALATLILYALGIVVAALFSGRGLRPAATSNEDLVVVRSTKPVDTHARVELPDTAINSAHASSFEQSGEQPLVVRKKTTTEIEAINEKPDDTSVRTFSALAKLRARSAVAKEDSDEKVIVTPAPQPSKSVSDAADAVSIDEMRTDPFRELKESLSSKSGDEVEIQEAARDEMSVAPTVSNSVEPPKQDQEEPVEVLSLSVENVRDLLTRTGLPMAISVSPTGDDGSTATVLLAREIAEMGRSVVLIDMSGSACPTRLMAHNAQLPGITDLLCGTTPFGETIHPDRLSDAHIIPQGGADPAQAMRGADRLGMIFDALTGAYDIVIIECGRAEPRSLARLTKNNPMQIVLSLAGAGDEIIASQLEAFRKAGYGDALAMTASVTDNPENRGRHAA